MRNNDRIISRIQKLLAIAEDKAASENEATMAWERAQKLMHEHAIQQWMLDHDTVDTTTIIEKEIPVKQSPNDGDKRRLARIVAEANQCTVYPKGVKYKCNGAGHITHIVFVGTEHDTGTAALLWQSMELYRASHWRAARRRKILDTVAKLPWLHGMNPSDIVREYGRSIPEAAFRNGYYEAFTMRIKERFDQLSQKFEETSTGRELVTMRREAIQRHMDGIRFSKRAVRPKRVHSAGLDAGRDAADRVGLGLSEVPGVAGYEITT